MKKHLLALAIGSAFVIPATAQNVTIDGIVDMSVQGISKISSAKDKDTVSRNNVATNYRSSSQLRFAGSEDLGGGLKANFMAVESLGNTEQSGTLARDVFSRGLYVALAGGFGEIQLGRPHVTFLSDIGTFNGGLGNFAGLRTTDGVVTGTTAATSRPGNSIVYNSPSFNGVTAQVVYSAGDESVVAANKKSGQQTSVSARGAIGNLSFLVGTAKQKISAAATNCKVLFTNSGDPTQGAEVVTGTGTTGCALTDSSVVGADVVTEIVKGVAALDGEIKHNGLGISYNFGVATVTYNFLDGKRTNNGAEDYKFRSQGIHVSFPMGAVTPFVTYRIYDNKTPGAADKDHTATSVGVNYTLSKRTNVYAIFDKISNDKNSAAGVYAATATSTKAGEDPSSVVLGIRHSF